MHHRLFFIFICLCSGCFSSEQKPYLNEGGIQKVDAHKLKIASVDAHIRSEPKRKVDFKIRKHPSAMYSQFVICTVTKPVRCNPSEKAPGIARTDDYEFLIPPAGDLEIKVRACVEPPYATNENKPCGKWMKSTVASETYGKGSLIKR